MYVSSPRRRRANPLSPIRIRRHANSPVCAGRSPVPWSPAQPTPPSGRSADFQPFPVSPESMTAGSEREPSPSEFMASTPTPWPTGILAGYGRAEGSSSRRESIESRTGGVPETPVSTPVGGVLPAGIAMAMRERSEALRELIGMDEPGTWPKSPRSPRSPRWRGGGRRSLRRMPNLESRLIGRSVSTDEMTSSRELFGRIVEIMDENEGVENTVSEGNGGVQEAFKRAVEVEDESEVFVVGQTTPGPGEIKERVSTARKYELRDGENHAQPISRWKYPWVVVMLVLFMLFVPSCKEII